MAWPLSHLETMKIEFGWFFFFFCIVFFTQLVRSPKHKTSNILSNCNRYGWTTHLYVWNDTANRPYRLAFNCFAVAKVESFVLSLFFLFFIFSYLVIYFLHFVFLFFRWFALFDSLGSFYLQLFSLYSYIYWSKYFVFYFFFLFFCCSCYILFGHFNSFLCSLHDWDLAKQESGVCWTLCISIEAFSDDTTMKICDDFNRINRLDWSKENWILRN